MTNAPKDKKQDRLDKRAAALKANMTRRKEFQKEVKDINESKHQDKEQA